GLHQRQGRGARFGAAASACGDDFAGAHARARHNRLLAARLLPRRLRHGEEATLVEHLGELRARIVVSLSALAVGFVVAYAFHGRILDWLNRPLPKGIGKPVTFSPAEPFLTSVKASLLAVFLLALPIILWPVWGFFAPPG